MLTSSWDHDDSWRTETDKIISDLCKETQHKHHNQQYTNIILVRVVGKHCVMRVYEEAEDVVVVHDDEGEGMLNTVSSVTTRHGKNVRKHVFLNTSS